MDSSLKFCLIAEGRFVSGVIARPDAGQSKTRVAFPARAVVLCSGGIGHLYQVTTNPAEARGTGLGMAARAGAVIADPEFVQYHPTAIDVGQDPAPLATEALRGDGARIAIDLMRYRPEQASGVMEFLFLALIEHYRLKGAREFSLGIAPLAGLSERRTAAIWDRFGQLMFRHGGAFYNFAGLRGFKQKFRPEWQPRYIALPPSVSPMVAMTDVALLIAGGARGILRK